MIGRLRRTGEHAGKERRQIRRDIRRLKRVDEDFKKRYREQRKDRETIYHYSRGGENTELSTLSEASKHPTSKCGPTVTDCHYQSIAYSVSGLDIFSVTYESESMSGGSFEDPTRREGFYEGKITATISVSKDAQMPDDIFKGYRVTVNTNLGGYVEVDYKKANYSSKNGYFYVDLTASAAPTKINIYAEEIKAGPFVELDMFQQNEGYEIHPPKYTMSVNYTTISKPVLVYVTRDWLGRLRWDQAHYHYKLKGGEKKSKSTTRPLEEYLKKDEPDK